MGILKKLTKPIKHYRKPLLHMCFASLVVAISVEPTFAAQNTSQTISLTPLTNMFNAIRDAITGPIGRAASIIALAATGIMFFQGRINWMHAVAVMLGITLVFGGATIISAFGTGTS